MCTAERGQDHDGFAIMLHRELELSLPRQQISEKLVRLRQVWIGEQRGFDLALRVGDAADARQARQRGSVIVMGRGVVWLHAKRRFEMVTRLSKIASRRKKIAKIVMRLSI